MSTPAFPVKRIGTRGFIEVEKGRRKGRRALGHFASLLRLRFGAPLGYDLERVLLRGHEPIHVSTQEEQIGESADNSERSFPLEGVAHDGCSVLNLEFMNVTEPLERALDHFIDETGRAIECGDPSDEPLGDTEVTTFEGDEVTDLEQALRSARFDDSLGGECGRFGVSTHVTRKIEAQLDGRSDSGCDNDRGHHSAVYQESIPPT